MSLGEWSILVAIADAGGREDDRIRKEQKRELERAKRRGR